MGALGALEHAPAAAQHDHPVEEHFTATPLLLGLGILVLYASLELRESLGTGAIAVGILAFVAPLLLWVKEDVHFWRVGHVDHGVAPGQPLGWWGMMFFLGTEVALFASLFAAFFVARGQHPGIWAAAHEHIADALPKVTINTIVLVSSGVFAHWALHSIRKDHRRNFFIGLLVAIALGATFLIVQVTEYATLISAGVRFSGDNFGNAFYGLTGTHAAHVFIGICFLTLVLTRGLLGQYDAKRHVSVDAFVIYWHFVDIVWIGLYLIVYVGVI